MRAKITLPDKPSIAVRLPYKFAGSTMEVLKLLKKCGIAGYYDRLNMYDVYSSDTVFDFYNKRTGKLLAKVLLIEESEGVGKS